MGNHNFGVGGQKSYAESMEAAQMRSSNSAPRQNAVVQIGIFNTGHDGQVDLRQRQLDPNLTSQIDVIGLDLGNAKRGGGKQRSSVIDTGARIQKFRQN